MASPNISFDKIPASIRKPGKYFEYNTKLAVRTLATNEQKMLIIAQKSAESDAPLEPVRVYDDVTAGSLFGFGSQAHIMARAAIRAYPYVDVSVLPVPPHSAGIAAAGTITVSGEATGAGVLTVTIGAAQISVAAAYKDGAAECLAELVKSVNGEPDLPVRAESRESSEPGQAQATITAKNRGTLGNCIGLSITSTVPGFTVKSEPMTGGQQDPDLEDALASVFGTDYTLYCVPWAAEPQLRALRDHLEAISGPLEQRRATAWLATTATLAACATLALALNSGRISIACVPGCPNIPEEISAAYCAVAASEEDPARPLNTLALTGMSAPPDVSRLSRTEQEVALKSGVTPLEVGPGNVVQIVRAISTYTLNANGIADVSLLDMTTIRTLDYVAKSVRTRIELRFPREKLSTRTPPKVRSEILDVLRQLEELEIVEEVAANADGVICERDSQDANRLNARIPADVVNGLHVFAGVIDLLL